MRKEMVMFDGRVFGRKVSNYGKQHGYLDYATLAHFVGDMILNNTLMTLAEYLDWEVVCGQDCYGLDSKGYECEPYSDECVDIIHYDVYQTYIISEEGSRFLSRYTDEIVYYNSDLDVYLWGITHFGTSWDYVLTDIKLVDGDQR